MPSEIAFPRESLLAIVESANKWSDHDIMTRSHSIGIVDKLYVGIGWSWGSHVGHEDCDFIFVENEGGIGRRKGIRWDSIECDYQSVR